MKRLIAFLFLIIFLAPIGCSTKYIARMEAEKELFRINKELIEKRLQLVEKVSSTPLVNICENGKCITVNQHIDSSLLNTQALHSDMPDPDGASKAAWGVVGNIFTTGMKVAAGAYLGHELVDFASTAVKNAGHNVTVTNDDGNVIYGSDNGLNKVDGDAVVQNVGDGTADGQINKPSESYNENGDMRNNAEPIEEDPIENDNIDYNVINNPIK